MGYLDVIEKLASELRESIAPVVVHGSFEYESGYAAATACSSRRQMTSHGDLRQLGPAGDRLPESRQRSWHTGARRFVYRRLRRNSLSNLTTPRLTTVIQPIAQIADAAVSALLGLREMPTAGRPVLFNCELAERASSAPAARARHRCRGEGLLTARQVGPPRVGGVYRPRPSAPCAQPMSSRCRP